jgi:ABC-type branched-subunit amino acid transport system ATPase component
MAQGRLLLSAPPDRALADPRVQDAYLGTAA